MPHGRNAGGSAGTVRFGSFQLDFRARELRNGGRSVRLQEQPFHILCMLLERPGEVVLREEIRNQLWPGDIQVEFDQSINSAVKRLREALRDSADNPRYIETMARRGYRLICPIEASTVYQACAINGPQPLPTAPPVMSEPAGEHLTGMRRLRRVRPLILAPALAVVAIFVSFIAWRSRRQTEPRLQPLIRLDVELGNDVSLGSPENQYRFRGADAILSPDGTRLLYLSRSRLFARRLDQATATELAGTEQAYAPFVSPDGQWVAFFTPGKMRKVALQGGPAIELCDAPLPSGGSWGEDGSIFAALDINGISRIPSTGGVPVRVTDLARGEITHRWPQVLPGPKALLFTAFTSMSGLKGATIQALSLKDHRRKTIVRGGTWAHYLPTGHLIYIKDGTLLAVLFDADRLEVRGTPVPLLERVEYSTALGSAQLDVSRAGMLTYRSSSGSAGLLTVDLLDNSGATEPLVSAPGNYLSPIVSPDGKQVALTSAGDVWVYELSRGAMMRVTFGGGNTHPIWSADSRYVLFRAAEGMFSVRADGSGKPRLFSRSRNMQFPRSFTADGKRLAFTEINPATGSDIWTVPVKTDADGLQVGTSEVFLQTPFNERMPAFSRDGRWLAYASDESGAMQVYVRSFPDARRKWQISSRDGSQPVWSPKANEIFFLEGGEQTIMVAPYTVQGDSFLPGKPRRWSQIRVATTPTTRAYDVAPDGKHIVALLPADTLESERAQHQVVFLLNFFDEVRRRVPRNPQTDAIVDRVK